MAREKLYNDFYENDSLEENESFDFVKLYTTVKKLLPWIITCALLGALCAWIYVKYQNPVYQINAKILIKDNEPKVGAGGEDVLQSLGIAGGVSSVENEMEIIQSPTLFDKVVNDLQLNVQYIPQDVVNPVAVASLDMPWTTNVLNYNNDKIGENSQYTLKVGPKNLMVSNENGFRKTFVWNTPVSLPAGTVVFSPKKGEKISSGTWEVTFSLPENTTDSYLGRINFSLPNKQTSVIALQMEAKNTESGKRVINKIIDTYIADNVKDNNSINDSTLVFITERLGEVTTELQDVEKAIQNFKQNNNITDISEQTRILLSTMQDNTNQLVQAEVQYDLVNSLEKFLSNNQYHIIPASFAQDPSLSSLISQYNQLVVQRERLSKIATPENPVLKNIESQISTVKNELRNSIRSTKNSAGIVLQQMRNQVNQNMNSITKIPQQERQFLDISRQQAIKQELYLFLLKKREEAAIGKSSTVSSIKVIYYARVAKNPVSPKKTPILLAGILLGVLLPLGIHYVRSAFNVKINNKEDIKKGTDAPILGEISHIDKPVLFEAKEHLRSPVAEQFRILRSNLHFYKKKDKSLVMMITSSMPGEGKTFISLNTAATIAANREVKVIVLGFDLRKPQLAKELHLHKEKGFSEYAIGESSIDESIHSIPGFSNLDVLPSGGIPPNPSELLMSAKTEELFAELRKRYDFIIVDCPPIVVTDYQIIGKLADMSMYVIRIDYTEKRQLEMADEIYRSSKIPKMSLVVNDFKPEKYDGYYNSYYYQYGYYESSYQPLPWWKRWFKS